MEKRYRCVIIDDEQPARDLLSHYISQVDRLDEVGNFQGVLSARETIERGEYDLVFLDIQMDELNGMDFLKIHPIHAPVILTTAYKEYAVQAFELQVIDYLLKPISFDRFYQSVLRVMARQIPAVVMPEFISLQSGQKLLKVALEDILFIQSDSEYVHFYTQQGEKIMVLESLKRLQAQLPNSFYRIHKSYLIAINKVTEQQGNIVRIGQYEIPIARANKKEALSIIFGRES